MIVNLSIFFQIYFLFFSSNFSSFLLTRLHMIKPRLLKWCGKSQHCSEKLTQITFYPKQKHEPTSHFQHCRFYTFNKILIHKLRKFIFMSFWGEFDRKKWCFYRIQGTKHHFFLCIPPQGGYTIFMIIYFLIWGYRRSWR